MRQLDAEIMRVDAGAELNLLHLVRVLMLLGFLVALVLLVAILAKINEPADGRCGVGGDLDEIHAFGTGQVDGVAEGEDAQLLPGLADDADFAGANLPINPGL